MCVPLFEYDKYKKHNLIDFAPKSLLIIHAYNYPGALFCYNKGANSMCA